MIFRKKRYIFICILIFIGCQSEIDIREENIEEDSKNIIDQSDIRFLNYLDLIPQLTLPIRFECESGFDPIVIKGNAKLIESFKIEGATIIGKLFKKNNYNGIIYGFAADIYYPILIVFDNDGLKLKEIPIFELKNCVDDINYSAKTEGVITKNYTIERQTTIVSALGLKMDTLIKVDTLNILK